MSLEMKDIDLKILNSKLLHQQIGLYQVAIKDGHIVWNRP